MSTSGTNEEQSEWGPLVWTDTERQFEVWIMQDEYAAYGLIRALSPSRHALAGVWLYNMPGAPSSNGQAGENHLVQNPEEYVRDAAFEPVRSPGEVSVGFNGEGLDSYVDVTIRGRLHACMTPRKSVGWCVLAKSGPYAKVLTVTQNADGSVNAHLEQSHADDE